MDILFESQDLYGRRLKTEDFPGFYDMQSNPDVMKYVGQDAMDEEACRTDLLSVIEHYSDEPEWFQIWGVFEKSTNEFVGTAAIINRKEGHELGFRLREKHWRKGYGTQISQATLRYGFKVLGLKEIFAEVDQRNIGSVKVLDRTMNRIRAFWNEQDQTDDYYYTLKNPEHEEK